MLYSGKYFNVHWIARINYGSFKQNKEKNYKSKLGTISVEMINSQRV